MFAMEGSAVVNTIFLLVFLMYPWPFHNVVLVASFCSLTLGLFGFFAVCLDKSSLICHYVNALIFVLIAEVWSLIGMIAVSKHSKVLVTVFLKHLVSHYHTDTRSKANMDYLHKTGHCCGMAGYEFWAPSPVPETCCNDQIDLTYQNNTATFVCNYYEHGCQSSYEILFGSMCVALVLATAINILISIFALADGFYLCNRYRDLSYKELDQEATEKSKLLVKI